MSKHLFFALIIITCIIGCSDEGSNDSSTNISGIWTGTAQWAYLSDPGSPISLYMQVDFLQTGAVVSGEWILSNGDSLSGYFTETVKSNNQLHGYLLDYSDLFAAQAPFSAIIGSSTITGEVSGTISDHSEDFIISFTIEKNSD